MHPGFSHFCLCYKMVTKSSFSRAGCHSRGSFDKICAGLFGSSTTGAGRLSVTPAIVNEPRQHQQKVTEQSYRTFLWRQASHACAVLLRLRTGAPSSDTSSTSDDGRRCEALVWSIDSDIMNYRLEGLTVLTRRMSCCSCRDGARGPRPRLG